MSLNPFPASRVLLLTPDGEIEALDPAGERFGNPLIVLARERCLFDPLQTPDGIGAGAGLTAVRLRAQTAAPYQTPGFAITRQGRRFGIWWWDAEWVAEKLVQAGLPIDSAVLPETLFYAPATAPRILKPTTGYEAQIWDQGFLVADLWRRSPFDEASWRAFQAQWGPADTAFPPLPAPQKQPILLKSSYRRSLLSSLTNEKLLELGAMAAMTLLLVATAFLFGEGISLERQTDAVRGSVLVEQSKAPARSQGQADVNQIIALKRELEHSDPLTLLRNAQEIVLPFGYKISAFSATRRSLTISLPEEAVAGVDLICTELNASPYFQNATPKLNHQKKALTIEMTVRGTQSLKPTADEEGT